MRINYALSRTFCVCTTAKTYGRLLPIRRPRVPETRAHSEVKGEAILQSRRCAQMTMRRATAPRFLTFCVGRRLIGVPLNLLIVKNAFPCVSTVLSCCPRVTVSTTNGGVRTAQLCQPPQGCVLFRSDIRGIHLRTYIYVDIYFNINAAYM